MIKMFLKLLNDFTIKYQDNTGIFPINKNIKIRSIKHTFHFPINRILAEKSSTMLINKIGNEIVVEKFLKHKNENINNCVLVTPIEFVNKTEYEYIYKCNILVIKIGSETII